jgi:hypothetical protein
MIGALLLAVRGDLWGDPSIGAPGVPLGAGIWKGRQLGSPGASRGNLGKGRGGQQTTNLGVRSSNLFGRANK